MRLNAGERQRGERRDAEAESHSGAAAGPAVLGAARTRGGLRPSPGLHGLLAPRMCDLVGLRLEGKKIPQELRGCDQRLLSEHTSPETPASRTQSL